MPRKSIAARRTGFLNQMPQDLRVKLEAAATPVTFGDGRLIHSRGDRKPGLSIIASGAVRMSNTDASGRQLTMGLLRPGDVFGEPTLFAGLPRTHDAVAIGTTRILQIPRIRFDAIMTREAALRDFVVRYLAQRLYATLEALDAERRLSTDVKLAKLLLSLAEREGDTGHVVATQHELSSALGVSRVSLGHALKKLVSRTFVRTGYGELTVVSLQVLRKWVNSRTGLEQLTYAP